MSQRIFSKRVGKWFGVVIATLVLVITVPITCLVILEAKPSPLLVNKEADMQNLLNIPPLLEPDIKSDGTKVFSLTLQAGGTEFFLGKQTKTWGANGNYLMPTIRASENDRVEIHVTSKLHEPTTMHWHGMHLPATMDGVHQIIDPDETWQPHWQIRQQAASLWYHPHLMGKTGEQVYRGLAGMFILEDETSQALNLPDQYSINDIPLIIQDREFDEDGQMVYRSHDTDFGGHTGMLGNTILVNGTYAPYTDVPGELVRLRILNGSNARRYNFGFSDNRTFYQIASDGGLLQKPIEQKRLQLAAAERAEILVDFSDLKEVTLMSYEVEDGKSLVRQAIERRLLGMRRDEGQTFKILALKPQKVKNPRVSMPSVLTDIERYDKNDAVRTRQFVLGSNTINGNKMVMDRIDEVVTLGTKEIWEISNPSGSHHPFHVHDVQFQILDRNGSPPEPHEKGWKDTVHVAEDETVRVMMEFTDYANPNVPYMYHCHILEHEDHGMMGQFVVVEEGTPESAIKVRSEALQKGIMHGSMHEH